MRSNEVNPITRSQSLQSEVQTIAGEIAHSPISRQKYHALSRKLGHALKALQGLEDKTKHLFLKTQTENLKEQVVKLYGDLEDSLVTREVTQIKEESTSLKKGRLTLKAVKQLEAHIHELEKNHLTSIPNRRIVADAKQALLEARAKLEGKPPIRHFDLLALEKNNVRFVEEIELLPGDIEELLDISKAVYNRNLSEAKKRYASLPDDHKRRFENHMRSLTALPFVDPLETMQCLIATANELVGNGEGYPSSSEIDQLFLGLSQANAEEGARKIFSLKQNKSF
jgi:hypothetical protein